MVRVAERAARSYIVSKLPKSEVEDLEIAIEVETNGELKFDVEIRLDTVSNREDYRELVDDATEVAHAAIKNELDRLAKH